MLPFIIILSCLSGTFYLAHVMQNHGWYWADLTCQQGTTFCDHPGWLLTATVVAILFEMLRTMAKN
jgi:hypothetical protein